MNGRPALVLLLVSPLVATACRRSEPEAVAPAAAQPLSAAAAAGAMTPLTITELFPPSAAAGVPFSVQDDGSSSLGVAGSGFTRTTAVYFDGQRLITNFASPKAVAGIVPKGLSAAPRKVRVELRDTFPIERRSSPVWFEIVPPRAKGAVPAIRELFPPSTRAGACFSPMPDGTCSLGVAGSNFAGQIQVVFDHVAVATICQGPTALVALVPRSLLAAPRRVKVTLHAPESRVRVQSVEFEIVP